MPKKGKKMVFNSEEEKLLYLQQRAQAEEELAYKRKEMMFIMLQEKLRKEGKTSTLSQLRLKEFLRYDLRIARTEQIKRKVCILPRTFQRKMDQLNFIVQKLLGELQRTELQGQQVRCTHLQQVERLWMRMDVYLNNILQTWSSDLDDLVIAYTTERARVLNQIQIQRIRLQDHILCTERSGREKSVEIETEFDNMLLTTWNRTYLDDTEEFEEEDLETLETQTDKTEQKVRRTQEELKSDLRLFNRMMENLSSIKADIMLAQDEAVEMHLKNSISLLAYRCEQYRFQLKMTHKMTRKHMSRLSNYAKRSSGRLRSTVTKGENLLSVGELCLKMERLHIITPPSPHWLLRDFENMDLRDIQEKLNVSVLDREVMRTHHRHLMEENKHLQFLLKQHSVLLDGGHKSSSKAPKAIRSKSAGDAGHAVAEANHALRHSK